MIPELTLFSYIPIVEIIFNSNWLQYTFSYPWLFSQFFLSFWKDSFLYMISLKWLIYFTFIFWFLFLWKIFLDMFKKHRQDCKHPKKYPIWYICNKFKFLSQILMKFCKKFDNYVTNPTTKKIFMKIKATQENW